MKTVSALLAVLAVLALPTLALADQCAWVGAEEASEASKAAVKGMKYIDYCEPCGDQLGRARAKVIETVEVKDADDGTHRELFINGEAKDLAYVFVQTGEGSDYRNLAAIAKCETDGVSKKVTIDAAKTAPKTRPKRIDKRIDANGR